MADPGAAPTSRGISTTTWTAIALAVAGVAVMVALAAADHDGWGWILQPILGLAAAVTAWRAGGSSPRNPVAFLAMVVGLLLVVVFLGFVIAEA